MGPGSVGLLVGLCLPCGFVITAMFFQMLADALLPIRIDCIWIAVLMTLVLNASAILGFSQNHCEALRLADTLTMGGVVTGSVSFWMLYFHP